MNKALDEKMEKIICDKCKATCMGDLENCDYAKDLRTALKQAFRVDAKKLARLMTQISEEKYFGKAFTYNYIVDGIANAIADNIKEIIS